MWTTFRHFQLILSLCVCLSCVTAKISNLRLCADPKCEVPISEGVTTLKYSSPWRDVLTFGQNSNVLIYSKSAGDDDSLWGVQIKTKRGYAPKRMLRETKVLFKGPLQYEVSTAEEVEITIPAEPVPTKDDPAPIAQEENIINNNSEEPKLIRIEEHELLLKVDDELNHVPSDTATPFKLTEAEEKQFADDPQVVLETIPNISSFNVPVPDGEATAAPVPPADVLAMASVAQEIVKEEEVVIAAADPQVPQDQVDVPAQEEPSKDALNLIEDKVAQEPSKEALNLNEEVKSADSTEPGVEEEDDNEDDYMDDEEEEDEDEEDDDEKEVQIVPNTDEKPNTTEQTKSEVEEVANPDTAQPIVDEPEKLPEPAALVQENVPEPVVDTIAVEAPEILLTTDNDNNNQQPEIVTEEASPTPIESAKAEGNPDEVVKSDDSDLPTPPSILLGDFINMNNGAVSPPPPEQPPMAMQFEDQPLNPNDLNGELENGTDSVQVINGTNEADKLTEGEQVPEDVPVVSNNDLPSVPQYEVYEPLEPELRQGFPIEGQGIYGNPMANTPPGQELPMEQRIPPIVQEKLNNDFYRYQNNNNNPSNVNSNEQATNNNDKEFVDSNQYYQQNDNINNNNNQFDYIHPPPPPPIAEMPSYQPVTQHDHQAADQIVPEVPQTEEKTRIVEEVVTQEPIIDQEEIPILLEPEETTTTVPFIPVVEVMKEEPAASVEEEAIVEDTGPGMIENLLTQAKSILGSIDITSMFKSADSPTADNSVIVGEHVEDEVEEEYCEKLSPDGCPSKKGSASISTPPAASSSGGMRHPMVSHREPSSSSSSPTPSPSSTPIDYESYAIKFLDTVLAFTDLILCLVIVAITLLVFLFMHLCFTRSQKENHFVGKLNAIERELMSAMKQNQILDSELGDTKHKLCSIEDNSFGSNDMVIAVRGQLEEAEMQRQELLDQVEGLEKELETAAEAGLELNRMVSELLSNQQGSETIISSVEGLQSQLNEQQETILAINTLLAEKSRENSELMVELSELRVRCEDEETGSGERVAELEAEVQKLEQERTELVEESERRQKETEKVQSSLSKDWQRQLESANAKNLKCEARIEALEESLKALEGSAEGGVSKADMAKLMSVARVKTSLLAAVKERDQVAERLEVETRSKATLEEQITAINEEVQRLRTEYNQMEKEKLEANTKLGILSSYFKEKETQLQKELSVREAECMQQQGETTSTVEKIRAMQQEIQSLKSHNESLKNEVEVQEATHKTQILSLENRAHETWLSSRQTERRLEESRSEAAVLRRKLTAMSSQGGENGVENSNMVNGSAHSPLLMDASGVPAGPGSPIMPPMPGFMPPPPFMPAPIMPHGFMPPPPFEMRPPPLGRLMSPPPPPGVNPGTRYSPHLMEHRGGGGGGGRYTPDSRYDHFSPYETETDISPPHSPQPYGHHHQRSRRSSGGSGTYNNNNNSGVGGQQQQQQQQNPKKFGKGGGHHNRNNYSDRSDEFV